MLWITLGSGHGGMELAMRRIARATDPSPIIEVVAPPSSKGDWRFTLKHLRNSLAPYTTIVHSFGATTGMATHAALVSSGSPSPHVIWIRNSLREWWTRFPKRSLILRALRRCYACVAVSETVRAELHALGIPSFLAPNWSSRVPQARDPSSHSFEGPILFVARLAPAKLPRLVLQSWFIAGQPRPLVFLGDGPLTPTIQHDIAALGVQENVSLAGYVENPQSLMRTASLLVHASEYEGHPNSVLEAYSQALPVVATPGTGLPEALAHGRYGTLSAHETSGSLAHAIHQVLSSRETWYLASLQAKSGSNAYSWPQIMPYYVTLIKGLVPESASQPIPGLRE